MRNYKKYIKSCAKKISFYIKEDMNPEGFINYKHDLETDPDLVQDYIHLEISKSPLSLNDMYKIMNESDSFINSYNSAIGRSYGRSYPEDELSLMHTARNALGNDVYIELLKTFPKLADPLFLMEEYNTEVYEDADENPYESC